MKSLLRLTIALLLLNTFSHASSVEDELLAVINSKNHALKLKRIGMGPSALVEIQTGLLKINAILKRDLSYDNMTVLKELKKELSTMAMSDVDFIPRCEFYSKRISNELENTHKISEVKNKLSYKLKLYRLREKINQQEGCPQFTELLSKYKSINS